ncbi:hypothetical protein [uncultured Desulfuromonas sp.]|uniref:translation initiation factor eIF-2B n=1 Tax=uncultured Desulfuromonas sp. TaxID=181013 RepID=UPI002AAB9491|nr:hypothetical protein [uncultured Desulfuromonas sp.]
MASEPFADFLHSFKADRQHGASELARQALAWLQHSVAEAGRCDEVVRHTLLDQVNQLCAARPSMSVIGHLLQRWQRHLVTLDNCTDAAELLVASAEQLSVLSLEAVGGCVHHARPLISPGHTLLTHSCSSTLMRLFSSLREAACHIVVCESRPLNEGVAVARQLNDWNIPCTLITDAQAGLYTAQADLVMVGADSLLGDGAVVNKVGTRLLALAAQRDHCPFYVVAESFKQRPPSADALILEQMDVAELNHDLPHEQMANTYFDITETDLISAWVDERGVHRQFSPVVW